MHEYHTIDFREILGLTVPQAMFLVEYVNYENLERERQRKKRG